jgi:glycosyltransferase involved in cell wall biosynthesis
MRNLSKLKLCFLAGTLEHGGAERQLFYILQALYALGASVRVLSLDQGEFWEKRIHALGVPVTCVGAQRSKWKRLFRVLKELRKDTPDILQSQHFYVNAYVSLVAKVVRATGIGALRNNGHSEMLDSGRLGGWLNMHLPGLIAANSRSAIEYALGQGIPASRLYFLPNVVDAERFKPAATASDTPVTLLAVGRIVKQKRFDRFVSLIARLRDLRLDVRGVIVGPSGRNEDLRAELETQARSLGLFPELLRFQDSVSDMRPVYHASNLCVLTSDFEGTPNVLLEAMASGLPVLGTRVGGVPEIVRHGHTGFLLEPADLDGLTAIAAELVKSIQLRREIGTRARLFVEQNHALQRLPSFLSRLYEVALPPGYHSSAEALPATST